MAIKKRMSKDNNEVKTPNVKNQVTFDQAESLANELADKTYGEVKDSSRKNENERLTITLNGELYDKIEDIARSRKKLKKSSKTMSAVVREALDEYIDKHNL